MTNTTNNTTGLANGTTTSAAAKIRRELAEKHDCPIKFINFGDCIKVAQGRKSASNVSDCWGRKLGSNASRLHYALLCDPECPCFAFTQNLADLTGLTLKQMAGYIKDLEKSGLLVNDGFVYSVPQSKRPFPQPMMAW